MNKEKEVEAYLKNELPEEEKLKYEIAQELGVLDKVLEGGWKSLSAKETGRIGGLVAGKRKNTVRMLFRVVFFCYNKSKILRSHPQAETYYT